MGELNNQPPRWADRLLEWYCREEYANEIRGDLLELYDRWTKEKGVRKANRLYLFHALLFMRAYNSRFGKRIATFNHTIMIIHYLKIAVRNMKRQKAYTLANITGLAIGLAVGLMIFVHADQELSYERDYPNHSTIYRLEGSSWAKSSPTIGPAFKSSVPGVKEVCRLASFNNNLKAMTVEGRTYGLNDVYTADQSAIAVFDYEFIDGNKEDALTRPNTAIITESLAKRVFKDKHPIGMVFELDEKESYEVTGVIRDLPENSHIKAEMLLSMPTMRKNTGDWWNHKGWMAMYTYVLFNSPEDARQAQAKLLDFDFDYHEVPEERMQEFLDEGDFSELTPITDIHLHSDKVQEMRPNSKVVYVYIFISLAIFILIIACVNFINIFITMSIRRIKEIGMRKVMGAQKRQLVQQFLGESLFTAVLSAVVALLICLLALPFYNATAEISIRPVDLLSLEYLIVLVGLVLVVGILAGAYPSFLVSGFGVSKALAAAKDARSGVSAFRKSLVVFQFVLSLFIIICTVAITLQMNYVQEKDLGYSAEHVVAIKAYGKLKEELVLKRESLFARLRENPAVQEVSLTSNLMGDGLSVERFLPADLPPEKHEDFSSVNVMRVDENFLTTMGIELLSGRNFRDKVDTGAVFIVNETLASMWGKENPVGEMAVLHTRGETGPIVGMVKDMNYYSLHQEVEPLLICYKPWWTSFLLVKIHAEHVPETLLALESFVKEVSPASIFHYRFLDDRIDALYKDEMGMFRIFRLFSVLAIIISCIGLLGLAAMEVQGRTKEIGIRKVLGASSAGILSLLGRKYLMMVVVAVLVTIPLSYYAIDRWLANFMYHIEPGVFLYFIPSVLFVIMAFALVCLQAFRVATANPSESLRYE